MLRPRERDRKDFSAAGLAEGGGAGTEGGAGGDHVVDQGGLRWGGRQRRDSRRVGEPFGAAAADLAFVVLAMKERDDRRLRQVAELGGDRSRGVEAAPAVAQRRGWNGDERAGVAGRQVLAHR